MELNPTDWQIVQQVLILRTTKCACGMSYTSPERRQFYSLSHKSKKQHVIMPTDEIPALILRPLKCGVRHHVINEECPKCPVCLPQRDGEPGPFYSPEPPAPPKKTLDDILHLL